MSILTISLYATWISKYLLYAWIVIFLKFSGHLLAQLSPRQHYSYLLLHGSAVLAAMVGMYTALAIQPEPVWCIATTCTGTIILTIACWQSGSLPIPLPLPPVFLFSVPIVSFFIGNSIVAYDNILWRTLQNELKQANTQISGPIIDVTINGKKVTYRMRVNTIFRKGSVSLVPGFYTVALETSASRRYHVGSELIIAPNKLLKKTPSHLPESNSFQDYARKEQILSHLYTPHDAEILVTSHQNNTVIGRLWNIRRHLCDFMEQQVSQETWTFIRFIFLGDTQKQSSNRQDSIRQHYSYWGLSHYLARSGLHLALLMSMWHFLLSFLPFHQAYKRGIRLFLCMLFWLFSWTSTPFLRTLLMMCGIEIGILSHAPTNALYLLGHIAWLLLCISPWLIQSIDFQLTFALSASLCLLCTKTTK